MSADAVDISVCIATFRRPQGLARLLESLAPFAHRPEFRLEVVVCDNDAAETARAVADTFRPRFAALRYFVEPEQNISHARNRAVGEARGSWVAFIDDDEVAGENWAPAYWAAAKTGSADGYFGPVFPETEVAPPAWLEPEVFLALPRPADGSLLGSEHMRTTNAFLRRELFAARRFDPAYGITGGGDYELFTRMLDAGAKFRWCDGAFSREIYSAARLRLGWLLQRAFRGGNTYTLVDRRRHPGWAHQGGQLIKALAGAVLFTALLPLDAVRGRARAVQRMQRVGVQLGHLWAFVDRRYEEYRHRATMPVP